jgi:hypothetical protein
MKQPRIIELDIIHKTLEICTQVNVWRKSEYENETESFTFIQTKVKELEKLLRLFRKQQVF